MTLPVPKFMRRPAAVTVPWELSKRPLPEEAVANEPSEAGRLLGAQLARLTDRAEEERRAAFPHHAPRCTDCAFKAGTFPNGCEETLWDAIKCATERIPFYCHKGLTEGDRPVRWCVGWLLLSTSNVREVLLSFAQAERKRVG